MPELIMSVAILSSAATEAEESEDKLGLFGRKGNGQTAQILFR
jgi:hypothetical protein